MDISKIFQSKIFKTIVWSLAALVVMLVVFAAGMAVGFRKASFSFNWGENYHRNFGGPRGGFMDGFRGNDLISGHGTVGQVLKIDGSTLIIKGPENVEKIVIVGDDTAITRFHEAVKITDLKVGDLVIVIGEPNEAGQIVAKFIRVMPPAPAGMPGQLPPPQPPVSSTPSTSK